MSLCCQNRTIKGFYRLTHYSSPAKIEVLYFFYLIYIIFIRSLLINPYKMKKELVFFVLLIIHLFKAYGQTDTLLYKDPDANVEDRIDDLISRMTLEEKILMLSGDTTHYDSRPNGRLGIPALRMADGPAGVRADKATAFPAPVCIASTWNTDLVYRLGQTLGSEAKAKNKNVLLGPCVNIHRVPYGGRNFESYGEDPFLASEIAVNYIRGVQSERIIATVKHFACNNQENERNSIDVRVDERTLNEIYFPAFRAAVQEGGVWSVMSAYNRLNGQHCSSKTWLLTDVLKYNWGFQGYVVSDWGAVHSTIPALYAGTDLEMPTDKYFKQKEIEGALQWRLFKPEKIDDKVRRMLRAMFHMGYFDQSEQDTGACDTPEHREVALKLAEEGIVLLKNNNNILPVNDTIKTIAVFGRNAMNIMYGGGGSSHVKPYHTIAPLEALKSKVGDNVTIEYASGTFDEKDFIPVPSECLIPPEGRDESNGLLGAYYDNALFKEEPVRKQIDSIIDFHWGRGGPEGVKNNFFSVIWEGQLVVPESGYYVLATGSDNGSSLYINGELEIDNSDFMRNETLYEFTTVELEKGKPVNIKIKYNEFWGEANMSLLWRKLEEDPMKKTIDLAKSSDIAILFVGYRMSDESEGRDRDTLALPRDQEELIRAVAEVNRNTVVVLNCGAGILMNSWIDKVPGIVLAWYPGQEGGEAIANILLGDVNPSGKLVTTFFKNWEDCPAYSNYPGKDDIVRYDEGVFVGYRYFDTRSIDPYFPFGHGLSYTSFEYSDLQLSSGKISQDENVTVSFKVRNTGNRDGAEVAQLYLGDEESSVPRPVKELKGFKKVFLSSGEETYVTLTIRPDDLKYYDICSHDWKSEPGKFNIFIGSSSRDIRLTGSFKLK
jgi:beta-glucosidase